jgi:hypothetical protein
VHKWRITIVTIESQITLVTIESLICFMIHFIITGGLSTGRFGSGSAGEWMQRESPLEGGAGIEVPERL